MSTSAALQKRKARKIEQLKDLRARRGTPINKKEETEKKIEAVEEEISKLQKKDD